MEASISQKLRKAILQKLVENPHLMNQDNPKLAAGIILAQENPEAFDLGNPIDRITLELVKMELPQKPENEI